MASRSCSRYLLALTRSRMLLGLLLLLLVNSNSPLPVLAQEASTTSVASTSSRAALALTGAPPENTLHFQSLPTPSGANPAYPLNHSFDSPARSLGSLVSNANFETPASSVGTPPLNSDFSSPPATVGAQPNDGDFEIAPANTGGQPSNADFETGTLSGWTTTGNVAIQSDQGHGFWAQLTNNPTLVSSAFTVDSSIQVFTFDLQYFSFSAFYVYALTGPTYSTQTQLTYLSANGGGGWQTVTLDASAYLGQSIKLKFAQTLGSLGIDNVHAQQILPGWSFSAGVSRSTDHTGYARLPYRTNLTSPAFTVDPNADSIVFDIGYLYGTNNLSVYALSGANYGTSTQIGSFQCLNSSCHTWQTASVAASAYRGQSIELQFSSLGDPTGIDNVRVQQYIPGYSLSGSVSRGTEANGNVYAQLWSGSLTSAAFNVDPSTQFISVGLMGLSNLADQYYLKVLSGSGYATITQVATGTVDDSWQTIHFNAVAWRGQSIELQVVQAYGNLGVDAE